MKTNCFTLLTSMALSLAAFSTNGCSQKEKTVESASPAGNNPVPAMPTPTVVAPAATTTPDVTSARWSDIKDDTYDQRVHFLDGLKRLEAKVDSQIAELTAKRATLTNTPSAADWDFDVHGRGVEPSRTRSMEPKKGQGRPGVGADPGRLCQGQVQHDQLSFVVPVALLPPPVLSRSGAA